jgi:hypothetical protein
MTVRCKVCEETFLLSAATVVVAAELATFTSAHDHETIGFDMVFEMVEDETTTR